MHTGGSAAVIGAAIERFSAGDDEGFAGVFAADATVFAEPQIASRPILTGRDEVIAWCREVRSRWSGVRMAHGELFDHGAGAYVELDVITESSGSADAWRLPIAVFVRDGMVVEVLPQ